MTALPPYSAAPTELTDDELVELDDLLSDPPEGLDVMDVVMLDGFLCGLIVQPQPLKPELWLHHIFDSEGRMSLDTIDSAWTQRLIPLVLARYASLHYSIKEHGVFEPMVMEFVEEDEFQAANDEDDFEQQFERDAQVNALSDTELQQSIDEDKMLESIWSNLPPYSRSLWPWVTGFMRALDLYPSLFNDESLEVGMTLARLCRHLPAQGPEEIELCDTINEMVPLGNLDEAVEDMVMAVTELFDLSHRESN